MISRRAQGPTRGQILLNGVPMSMRLFQESCGYVTQKCDLLEGLSVEATLMYAASISLGRKVSSYVKTARVKQVALAYPVLVTLEMSRCSRTLP